MYFEDDKDIVNTDADLHIAEDGTVSWEDILSDQDEDTVQFLNDDEDGSSSVSSESDIKGSDFVESKPKVKSEQIQYDNRMSKESAQTEFAESQNIAEEYHTEDNISDDFDIDKQLEQISFDESSDKENFAMPNKETKKSNSTPIILALLVALIVMGGVYYYFTAMQGSDIAGNIAKLLNPGGEGMQKPDAQSDEGNINNEEGNSDDAQAAPQEVADNGPIQVVNDENVNEIKPQEPPKEEKKQVVAIVPTGRINPFLPLEKYSQTAIKSIDKEIVVQYDKVGIPAPPEKLGVVNHEAMKMLTIAVSGIMYDDIKPSAIITLDGNDYFVQKNDKLDEYKVIDIGRNFVTIAYGKNIYKANVGEEFKISSNFYGSAKYFTQNKGDGRQYYSVSPQKEQPVVQKPDVAAGTNRYVSEEEVEIKAK